MNNKLIARVVAGAMAVAMLGTVSFATKIDADKDTVTPGTITESGYAAQAEKTFMAFATDTASTDFDANSDVIIALGQESDLPGTIPVDSAKLGKKYVVAVYSGTNGVKVTSIVDVSARTRTFTLPTEQFSTTFEVEENGEVTKQYTNLAYAEYEFPVKDSKLEEVGFTFTGTKTVDAKLTVDGTEITGTGNIKYAAVVIGVPSTETITAVPYATYADFVE